MLHTTPIPSQRRDGFTLVEIMIVVAIIAILAMLALPSFLRARKRSQATLVLNELRILSTAIDQYAIETNKSTVDVVRRKDLQSYLKKGTPLYNTDRDVFGNRFEFYFPGDNSPLGQAEVDSLPAVNTATFGQLSDVAPSDFWSPYIFTAGGG